MASKVVKKLYKTVLKLSKNFDQNPDSKSLLYRKSLSCSTHKDLILTSQYYNKILNQIFLPEKYIYYPNSDVLSFTQIAKKEFREKIDDMSIPDRTFVAFAILRNFFSVWQKHHDVYSPPVFETTSEGTIDTNSNSNDMKRLPSSVKETELVMATLQNVITPGTILLSHPMIEGSLRRAIILIIQHNTKGSYGLVLNRQNISYELKDSLSIPSIKKLNLFSHQNVSFGGNIRRLQYIHTIDNVGGIELPFCSADSTQKYYCGGDIKKLKDAIKSKCDRKSRQNFIRQNIMFFVGCCTWDVNQLQKEYDSGLWIPVTTADTDKVLKESFLLQTCDDAKINESCDTASKDGDDNSSNNDDDIQYNNQNDGRKQSLRKALLRNHKVGGRKLRPARSSHRINKSTKKNDGTIPKGFITSTKRAHLRMMSDISLSENTLGVVDEDELQRLTRIQELKQSSKSDDKLLSLTSKRDGFSSDFTEFQERMKMDLLKIHEKIDTNDDFDDDDNYSSSDNEYDEDEEYDEEYEEETYTTKTNDNDNATAASYNKITIEKVNDEDHSANDRWSKLMLSLGEEYKPLAQLPIQIDTSKVTSVDFH